MKDPNLLVQVARGELSLEPLVCVLNRQALVHVDLLHLILLVNLAKERRRRRQRWQRLRQGRGNGGTEVAALRCARDLCYNSMLSEYPSEPSCHSEALAACAFLQRRKFSSSSPSTAERKDFQQEAIRTQ
jgi:hypothetical protein